MKIEICLGGDSIETVRRGAEAASAGGAARLELCREMHHAGLTPSVGQMKAARAAWGQGGGLMIMVRPRGGDFCYTRAEVDMMAAQIEQAAAAGADGVVIGVLRPDGKVSETTMRRMMLAAGKNRLTTTFHRAFDATPNPTEALKSLVDLGVDRVLTSGCLWGSGGTALEGAAVLRRTIIQAMGRIEVVISGGITAAMLRRLQVFIPLNIGPVSVHAYSGAHKNGVTDAEAVRVLVSAAEEVSRGLA